MTLTFDQTINRDHLIKYCLPVPKLNLLRQSVLQLSVAQGEEDWHDYDLGPTDLTINRVHLLIKATYQVWSLWGKAILSYQLHKAKHTGMTFDLDLLTKKWRGIIYSSRTIYLPSKKLLGQSNLELLVAQG